MHNKYQSDFEIGYNYARQKYPLLNKRNPKFFCELSLAYLLEQGVTAELSRGMGIYYLEQAINMLMSENTLFSRFS